MRLKLHHDYSTIDGSMLLGVLISWNTLYSYFIFFISALLIFAFKVSHMNEAETSWYAAIMVLYFLCEVTRLHLGYRGNVDESVSHLFGFLAITVFSHITIMIVYLLAVPDGNAMDFAMAVVQLAFGGLEVMSGFFTMRRFVRRNTVEFYLHLGA